MSLNETKTIEGLKVFDATQATTSKDYPLNKAYLDYMASIDSSKTTVMGSLIGNNISYGENKMDSNELLKAYMEKVDRDQSDLRSDIRESERRTSANIDNIERRMDERLNRIEDMISNSINKNNEKIEALESKIDGKTRWVVGTCIATIVGIAAMVVTVVTAIG